MRISKNIRYALLAFVLSSCGPKEPPYAYIPGTQGEVPATFQYGTYHAEESPILWGALQAKSELAVYVKYVDGHPVQPPRDTPLTTPIQLSPGKHTLTLSPAPNESLGNDDVDDKWHTTPLELNVVPGEHYTLNIVTRQHKPTLAEGTWIVEITDRAQALVAAFTLRKQMHYVKEPLLFGTGENKTYWVNKNFYRLDDITVQYRAR